MLSYGRGIYFSPMFTGIIEERAIVQESGDNRLTLSRPESFQDIAIGSSIAVAGVCLSVVALNDRSMTFDVIGETLQRSTLGTLRKGESVNLERAMRADDRFEGHMVQGHVEGTGEILSKEQNGTRTLLTIRLPEELIPTVVSKGSITLDGVSLTVASIQGSECSVALIPHTLEYTTLGELSQGDSVNIETDVLGRYVHSLLSRQT